MEKNYKYQYNWQIGIYDFNIYTKRTKLNMPFHYLNSVNNKKNIRIKIFLNEDILEKNRIISFCRKKGKEYIPDELDIFYHKINKLLDKNLKIKNHINKYYKYKNYLFAHFPYSSDNFILQYSDKYNYIKIYGNVNNLYRIVLDFLTINQRYLPLHASAISKNNHSFSFIGESGGGKTSFLIKLLQKNYKFLADDSVFANNFKIFPTNYFLSVRKNFPNHPEINKIIKNHKEEKVFIDIEKEVSSILLSNSINISKNNFYIIQSKENKWEGISKMNEPFPCIAHHSFWCTKFLIRDNKNLDKWIENKLKDSILFWENKTKNAEEITIDFNKFEKEIEKFDNYFSKIVV